MVTDPLERIATAGLVCVVGASWLAQVDIAKKGQAAERQPRCAGEQPTRGPQRSALASHSVIAVKTNAGR